MLEYKLIVEARHIGHLLEALRNHQVMVEAAPSSERDKAVVAELTRRGELLSAVVDAGDDYKKALEAYESFCRFGDTTQEGGNE